MIYKNMKFKLCLFVVSLLFCISLPVFHLSADAKIKASLPKASMNSKAEEELVYIDNGPNSIYLNYYVNNLNQSAEYSVTVNDPDVCQTEVFDEPGSSIRCDILGLTEGETSLTITETYLGKSRVIGDIEVNVSTKPESLELNNKYKNAKKNEKGELYFTVVEGINGNIHTLFDVAPKLLKLHYYSNNNSVISIDDETGIFKAGIPGKAKITISGWTAELNIEATVISKNNVPGVFAFSEKYVAAVNALDPEAINQDNLLESYQQLIDTYKIIGKEWPEGDGIDDSDLYTFIGSMGENFWAIPNIKNMEGFRETLIDNLYKFARNVDKERKIEKISQFDAKTLEIKLNIPYTEQERAYHSLTGNIIDAIMSYNLYNKTGTVKVDSYYTRDVDGKIHAFLKKPLPNGTYIMEIPSYTLEPITYSFIKKGNVIKEYKK